MQISTSRIPEDSAAGDGLSKSQALAVFQEIVTNLGGTVKQVPDPGGVADEQYIAQGRAKTTGRLVGMEMHITQKHIDLYSRSGGSAKDFAGTKEVAAFFEKELQKRSIPYRLTTRSGNP